MSDGWKPSRGSAPKDVNMNDIYEFRRDGFVIGIFQARNFNWDLWCEYRPVFVDASSMVQK